MKKFISPVMLAAVLAIASSSAYAGVVQTDRAGVVQTDRAGVVQTDVAVDVQTDFFSYFWALVAGVVQTD